MTWVVVAAPRGDVVRLGSYYDQFNDAGSLFGLSLDGTLEDGTKATVRGTHVSLAWREPSPDLTARELLVEIAVGTSHQTMRDRARQWLAEHPETKPWKGEVRLVDHRGNVVRDWWRPKPGEVVTTGPRVSIQSRDI